MIRRRHVWVSTAHRVLVARFGRDGERRVRVGLVGRAQRAGGDGW